MTDANPYWIMLARFLRRDECDQIVRIADEKGWRAGTFADGSFRDNVSVCFLKPGELPDAFPRIVDRMKPIAAMLGIDVWPEKLESVQVSKWGEGDNYGWHSDNDNTGGTHSIDRKLSLYVSLSPGGGLEIDKSGLVNCRTGDALAFSGHVGHKAPKQETGERHSLAAWIPGPRWR